MREQKMGRVVRFLLPSLKLKQAGQQARTVEEELHRFLTAEFGGYTAASGNLFGYWKDDTGREQYGEHREFTVALKEEDKLTDLKKFLAAIARRMGEQCVYLEIGYEASQLWVSPKPKRAGKHESNRRSSG